MLVGAPYLGRVRERVAVVEKGRDEYPDVDVGLVQGVEHVGGRLLSGAMQVGVDDHDAGAARGLRAMASGAGIGTPRGWLSRRRGGLGQGGEQRAERIGQRRTFGIR